MIARLRAFDPLAPVRMPLPQRNRQLSTYSRTSVPQWFCRCRDDPARRTGARFGTGCTGAARAGPGCVGRARGPTGRGIRPYGRCPAATAGRAAGSRRGVTALDRCRHRDRGGLLPMAGAKTGSLGQARLAVAVGVLRRRATGRRGRRTRGFRRVRRSRAARSRHRGPAGAVAGVPRPEARGPDGQSRWPGGGLVATVGGHNWLPIGPLAQSKARRRRCLSSAAVCSASRCHATGSEFTWPPRTAACGARWTTGDLGRR